MNQEPILTLSLGVEEVNKILTGLAQKIVQVSQIQINEHNKKLQEEQEKAEKEANKKNKEGENK